MPKSQTRRNWLACGQFNPVQLSRSEPRVVSLFAEDDKAVISRLRGVG